MHHPVSLIRSIVIGSTILALSACSEPEPPARQAQQASAEPSQAAAPTRVAAPAGLYRIDPNHANIGFSVSHLGLSNYVARFSEFEVSINLVPDDPAASSLQATIYPASVKTDYVGDYKATHKDSPFDSWDQALAQDERFFNAGQYPEIRFNSTSIKDTGSGTLQITGDLSMRGQTHPVTLAAELVGDLAEHPFSGIGAIGFSASGSFSRSQFGMDHLTNPPLIGDEVTLLFEGEFNQVVEEAAAGQK